MDLTWLTDALNSTANAYGTVKAADALKHQQTNEDGNYYTAGAFQAPSAVAVPTTMLLIGAAVLLFVFMKD